MQQLLADLAGELAPVLRRQVIAKILDAPHEVVLVEAAAGMGKSVLLQQIADRTGALVHHGAAPPERGADAALVLWDLPAQASLAGLPDPAALPEKLVIALRPEQAGRAIMRRVFYGTALRIDGADLLLTADDLATLCTPARAAALVRETAGWPALCARRLAAPKRADGGAALDAFLAAEILPELSARDLVALILLCDGEQPAHLAPGALVPLVRQTAAGLALAVEHWRRPLQQALAAEVGTRMATAAQAAQLAEAYLHNGHPTAAILALQKVGYLDWALELFTDAGGLFYIYRYGGADYDRVLAGFPDSFTQEHEVLILSRAMQALKHGDLERARRVLTGYAGGAGGNPATVLNNAANYSLQLRYFRLMMLIYEDIPLTDELLDQAFRLLADMPVDADLPRGCMLNAIMEFYMRRRRFAQVEDIGERAHRHYTAAGVPILQFYINLHRAIMRLSAGDAVKAGRYAAAAARELSEARFDSPGDARLLRMVEGCIAFEGGRAAQLVDVLTRELDGLTHGEMWPSIAECLLHYGSQALAEHFSAAAGRDFLDRWRVYQRHNRQFQAMIEIREAVTLQNANRWHVASETLAAIDSRITRSWVQRAGSDLARLEDRDEILLALAWLRQMTFESPRDRELEQLMSSMAENLNLSGRQRLGVEIWQAYLRRNQGDFSRARQMLQKLLEDAGRQGALAPLAEERLFLRDLMGNQRIADFVLTSPPVRQVLRRLSALGSSLQAAPQLNGLTRRETRVLLLISEGGSNKFIAQALGLSEATVKFHLGNLYRKLGCSRRKEAISAARSLGLVG